MGQYFEHLLKEKMDGAALEDHMPEYNLDGEWSGLSDRLQEKYGKQKKVIPVMWSHAAAILVGVTIGFFLLKGFSGKQHGETTLAYTSHPVPTPAAQPTSVAVAPATRIDTVIIVREQPGKAIVKTGINNKPLQQRDTVMVLAKSEPILVQQSAIDSSVYRSIPKAEILVATTTRKRPQAIHMLDMRNEDRDLINTPEYQGKSKNVLTRVQKFLFNSDVATVSDDNKPYVVRHILNK